MASYTIRKIDAGLWRLVKTKAASEGVSIRAVIEALLRSWLGEVKS